MPTTTETQPTTRRKTAQGKTFQVTIELTTLPGKRLTTAAITSLRRPYIPISEEQYQRIMEMTARPETDIVLLGGMQHTFGKADSGYALMPLGTPI